MERTWPVFVPYPSDPFAIRRDSRYRVWAQLCRQCRELARLYVQPNDVCVPGLVNVIFDINAEQQA